MFSDPEKIKETAGLQAFPGLWGFSENSNPVDRPEHVDRDHPPYQFPVEPTDKEIAG
jgi:hypothetical protein